MAQADEKPAAGEQEDTAAIDSTTEEDQPCRLLALPAELRLEIFDLVLFSTALTQGHVPQEPIFSSALLYTNHQILDEVQGLFFRLNAKILEYLSTLNEVQFSFIEATSMLAELSLSIRPGKTYEKMKQKLEDVQEQMKTRLKGMERLVNQANGVAKVVKLVKDLNPEV